MLKCFNYKTAFVFIIVCILSHVFLAKTAVAFDFKRFTQPKHRIEIVATGYGKFPNLNMPLPQKKLLAKRAAMLDAYRKILLFLEGASEEIYSDRYTRRVTGNIKNVKLINVNYDIESAKVIISVEPFLKVDYNRNQILNIAHEYECNIIFPKK